MPPPILDETPVDDLQLLAEADSVAAHFNDRARPMQQWLLPYENPFARKKGREFFRSIPKKPGVYLFLGVEGSVLYVGKAKCLRDRINSYRHARPGRESRKTIRMLSMMRELRWEECESETAALLRENDLLRTLRPPFNVLNTRPDTYYFVAIRALGGPGTLSPQQIRFRLTLSPRKGGDLLYGAFKGRGAVRRGYSALLRLVWAAQNVRERFEFPHRLMRPAPVYVHTTDFPADWVPHLKRFLNGSDAKLLELLTLRLLENPSIPPFQYRVIQDDLEEAREFFARILARHRAMRRNHGVSGRIIPQDRVDDILVLENQRRLDTRRRARTTPAPPHAGVSPPTHAGPPPNDQNLATPPGAKS